MLRRKLLTFLGSLIALMLVASIASIWMLQGVLAALDHAAIQDGAVLQRANQMTDTMTQIEIELREIQLAHTRHLDPLLEQIMSLKLQTEQFGARYEQLTPEGRPTYEAIVAALATFERQIAMLATVQDETLAQSHTAEAIGASITLRQQILMIDRLVRDHTANEQRAAVMEFRWVVLSLTVIFLVLINTSFLILLRMSHMVTQPVERLVDASRHLAHEEFTHRVTVGGNDEFGELAAAYNYLAEQLQMNERRKLETLGQTAIMLNHELNNASAIITMQLQLLQRQRSGDPAFERALRQIQESLRRMTGTVEALKRVRRIVLTNYTADTKMLDLAKSIEEDAV